MWIARNKSDNKLHWFNNKPELEAYRKYHKTGRILTHGHYDWEEYQFDEDFEFGDRYLVKAKFFDNDIHTRVGDLFKSMPQDKMWKYNMQDNNIVPSEWLLSEELQNLKFEDGPVEIKLIINL